MLATVVLAAALSSCEVDALELRGFARVKPEVVEELLPRALPTCLRDDELVELRRRLWALGLFDDVHVARRGDVLDVRVREKWTLIPIVEAGTARTLRDSYLSLSLTEANVAGRAIECGVWTAYYQRAITGEAWCAEHQNGARRPSFEGSVFDAGSGFVFDDADYAWERRRTGGHLGVRLPFWYGTPWRLALLVGAYHERLSGDAPASLAARGVTVGFGARVIWDRLQWHDLVPRGARFVLEAHPAIYFRSGVDRPRHEATTQLLSAFRLAERTALLVNVVAEAASPGDPNHSYALGSVPSWRVFGIGGIRGLPDNRIRDAFHAYADVELRQSLELAERWFLQGVAFVDGGTYAHMDPFGNVQRPAHALSAGLGVRVVPTFLAWMVPRVDAGSLLVPTRAWFVSFGLSQYF